jgi:two-component system sensor histidine kinase NreB
MHRLKPLAVAQSPVRLFALLLVITFAVEAAIMVLAPAFIAVSGPSLMWALVDAAVLTVVMAPAIWIFVVRPLRYLLESREQLIHSLFHAQDQERSRIARDLHDEIGQQLTAIQIGLGSIEAAPDLARAQQLAHDLRGVGLTAHEEVRRLAAGLRPGVLEDLGLAVAIERLCEDFERMHGLDVQLDMTSECTERLGLLVETTLYRVVQESLTNVARHADATQVQVSLVRGQGILELVIADDGKGMLGSTADQSSRRQQGLGLNSIRERVQMLSGECTITASSQGGVMIKAVIPA